MKSYLKELSNGTKVWRNNKDQYHREDGPAIEWTNGCIWYYINDKHLTYDQFKKFKLRKRLKELIK